MRNDMQRKASRAPLWVLGVASVASLMVALDMLVVTTALSTIRVHLAAERRDELRLGRPHR
jgi:hypothetical protein